MACTRLAALAGEACVKHTYRTGSMRAKDLLGEIEKFQLDLARHQEIWGNSLDHPIPQYPVRNTSTLISQSRHLSRDLGRLRPYLQRFRDNWLMHHPATGAQWDALEAATGSDQIAQIKGPSLRTVIGALDQIIGELQSLDPDEEIPKDPSRAMHAGGGPERVAMGYVPYLHPFIHRGCSKLLEDGHFAQTIEESVKAVMQYLRDATGLTTDGAELVNQAFSLKSPFLALGDLEDETTRNEQVGLMDMIKGFIKGVRHPLAHTQGRQESFQRAFEYVVFASILCRRIDDAKVGVGSQLSSSPSPSGARGTSGKPE